MEVKIENVNPNISGNTIKNSNVNVISVQDNSTSGAVSEKDAEFLRELQEIRKKLETTEPMIAGTLTSMEQALKARNETTFLQLCGQFAAGSAKAVIASVASKAFLARLGIQ